MIYPPIIRSRKISWLQLVSGHGRMDNRIYGQNEIGKTTWTSLSGSDQRRSQSRPWSGTSHGRPILRICSIVCKQRESVPFGYGYTKFKRARIKNIIEWVLNAYEHSLTYQRDPKLTNINFQLFPFSGIPRSRFFFEEWTCLVEIWIHCAHTNYSHFFDFVLFH